MKDPQPIEIEETEVEQLIEKAELSRSDWSPCFGP